MACSFVCQIINVAFLGTVNMWRHCFRISTICSRTERPHLITHARWCLTEVRYVSANGGIRWNKQWVNVSITCVGEHVGLEEIDDGIWNVYFGSLKPGRLLERHMRIEDAFGRLCQHR